MKICSKCREEKPLTAFYKDRSRPDGYKAQCKTCQKKVADVHYAENRERIKNRSRNYYAKNKERVSIQKREYCQLNKQEIADKSKLWRENNPEKVKERSKKKYAANRTKSLEDAKKWRDDNPEKARKLYNRSDAKRLSTPKGKLNRNMTRGIHASIKQGSKAGRHWESLVDFTINQLRSHLEKLFTPEMTWENQGSCWHIDHRIPKAAFNFETP